MTTDLQERIRLEAALLARRAQRPVGIPVLPRPQYPCAFPVSPIQQLLWQFHHECPGESTWLTLGGIRIYGPLDLAVLKRAFDAMTERHESLRTVFRTPANGTLEQVVLPPSFRLAMPLHDVSPEQAEAVAEAVIDEPFDLVHGPLTRFSVLRLAPQEHHLMLVQHHIVSDGASAEIFITELAALYLAFAAGAPDPLPRLAAQPADLATWQRERLDEATRRRLAGYWTERLAGADPLRLPADRLHEPVPSSAGLTSQLLVEPETMQALRRLGKENSATPFMVTLAAFQILFAWYTGQREAMVATPYSYRDRPETYAPIGAFINYLMLRTDLSGDPDFREVLRRVRDNTLRDFEHHQLPFNDLIEALGLEPATGRYVLIRALFTEESDPEVPLDSDGPLRTEMIADPPWHHALRDFTLRVTTGEEGTHVVVTYRADAFTAQRAADIAADYRDVLRLAARDPGFRVFPRNRACPRQAALGRRRRRGRGHGRRAAPAHSPGAGPHPPQRRAPGRLRGPLRVLRSRLLRRPRLRRAAGQRGEGTGLTGRRGPR